MKNEKIKKAVMEDIVRLSRGGARVVLIHGGGPEISLLSARLGIEPAFIDGLRVTDRETLDVVLMVLAGKVNKELVNIIESLGAKCAGVSGVDGNIITASCADERLGFVGNVESADPSLISVLLENGFIPVISSVARGTDGTLYNVNGDTAAAYIAGVISADALILMTDAPGVLTDKDDPSTLVKELSAEGAREMIESGTASDGMIPKLRCCIKAVELGVGQVSVIDGKEPGALLRACSPEGCGTRVYR